MFVVGLTGGIGSGKSTVSRRLAEKGALVIDADAITRDLQEPGTAVFDRIVARFGDGVVGPDGRLDRPALAGLVFNDPEARRDLEAIVHPAVAAEAQRRTEEVAAPDGIVVYDVPLLVEAGRTGFDAVVVVDVEPEIALDRLVGQRGMVEADVRARMASQATREQRRAVADRIIDNSDGLDALDRQVDGLWDWLVDKAADSREEGTT